VHTVEQSEINQIVLASVSAAGPVGDDLAAWNESVSDMAARITAMCSPTSSIAKIVAGVANSKVFTATVMEIKKESSSTRGLVTLKTRPSKFHEDGIEQARTERTDSPDGLAMARRLRGLVGHRVAIWVEVEEINDGANKVRVVRHVEDLGLAKADGDQAAA
jgi:hypothetical protein